VLHLSALEVTGICTRKVTPYNLLELEPVVAPQTLVNYEEEWKALRGKKMNWQEQCIFMERNELREKYRGDVNELLVVGLFTACVVIALNNVPY
jgi:hypothetical protein